jgi:hypothetical protein
MRDDAPEKTCLTTSLPVPLEIYDNKGASEKWEEAEQGEKPLEMKNKTIEDIRRTSASSIRKPSSPFRRLSSPLTRSGRFSITSFFGRRSMDMEAEAVNLMTTSPVSSPTGDGHHSIASNEEGES